MSDKSQIMDPPVAFQRSAAPSMWSLHLPTLPILLLITVVGFLVLTPLFLMILNSFQTARPGQPIVWGVDGCVETGDTARGLTSVSNTVKISADRPLTPLFVVSPSNLLT